MAVITFIVNLQSELIAMLVALDRVAAVYFAIVYRQKGYYLSIYNSQFLFKTEKGGFSLTQA